jgi:hypothetical protein
LRRIFVPTLPPASFCLFFFLFFLPTADLLVECFLGRIKQRQCDTSEGGVLPFSSVALGRTRVNGTKTLLGPDRTGCPPALQPWGN